MRDDFELQRTWDSLPLNFFRAFHVKHSQFLFLVVILTRAKSITFIWVRTIWFKSLELDAVIINSSMEMRKANDVCMIIITHVYIDTNSCSHFAICICSHYFHLKALFRYWISCIQEEWVVKLPCWFDSYFCQWRCRQIYRKIERKNMFQLKFSIGINCIELVIGRKIVRDCKIHGAKSNVNIVRIVLKVESFRTTETVRQ